MHDSVRDKEETGQPSAPEPPGPGGLLDELGQLVHGVRRLFGAQLHLLAAELGLARSAVHWMLAAALVATVAGVGFGLTLLGLAGLLLAKWFHSWILAFALLALLEALTLFGAIVLFRRCMHWMSLPATRQEWRAIMRDTLRDAERRVEAGEGQEPERGEQA